MKTICGLDCGECWMKEQCGGCRETGGKPFGGTCMIAVCCTQKGCANCGNSFSAPCRLKKELAAEFNALGIEDMEEVTDLNALHGAYINLQYTLPGGQQIRFWDDDRIYLASQLPKKNSDRCYGLTADENYLLVCEYGENGTDPEIVVFRRREKKHMADSRCGLHCTGCTYKESCGCGGCIETNGHPFHGECPVAVCCQQKGIVHCGQCGDMPCELLRQYSCDPEHGDTPAGARMEQCRKWKAEEEQ